MTNSAICPLPERGVLQVAGPEARAFLQNLITNDMDRVTPSQAIYAALLTPQGKYLFDFFVVQAGEPASEQFLIDCEANRAADLAKRLTFYKLRAKAVISNLDGIMGVVAYLGAAGLKLAQLPEIPGAAKQWLDGVVFTDPRAPAIGARAIIPAVAIARHSGGAGPDEYDRMRLQLGLPDGARDIQVEKYFLLEANFEELNGVDFKKGCYVGQELVSRMKHRGAVRKRIIPVIAQGHLAAPGTPISQAGREVGTLLSGRDGHALAYLRVLALSPGAAPLMAGNVELEPHIPDWFSEKLTFTLTDDDDES